MAGDWRDTTLGDFLTLQRGFDLPQGDRVFGPYPVIASTGPVGTHSEAMVKGPGVVIGRSGSLGGGQYIRGDFWPLNTTLWVKAFNGNDPRFCYFLLKSIDFARFNAGSGVPTLNRNHIHPLPVRVPSLKEQQAIACILGALDDKIELNRRMNKTLETTARAIFKSWFVDFDPVRAKAAIRREHPGWSNEQVIRAACPNLKPEIAALFLDTFVDSELGKIPRGWKVKTVGDVCELAYGKALKADQRQSGQVPVMGSNGQVGLHNEALVEGPGIVVGRKGNPGIITWVNSDFFPIDTTFYVVPHSLVYPLTYLAYALENLNLASLGADSAVPGLNRNIAYKSSILIPDHKILDIFDGHSSAIRHRQSASEKQSHTLAALRDALLPKLISGELRVPDAERIAGRYL